MGVKIYVLDVSHISENEIDIYLNRLSKFRRKKVNSLSKLTDKKLSVGVGLLLDIALKPYGLNESDMTYRVNEYGKSEFENFLNIHFSFSHSGNYAVCAISDNRLGCDIEKIGRVDMKIANRFFTKAECDRIKSLNFDEQKIELAKIWTVKESYGKAIGRGVYSVLGTDINDIDYNINTFYDINDYVLSCCSEDNDVNLNIIDIKNDVD